MKNFFTFLMAASCLVAQEETPVAVPEQIHLRVGESVTLELKGNPTTGFTWNLAEPMQPGAAVFVSLSYGPLPDADEENPCCGAPRPTLVKMTGVSAGHETFTLEYRRIWEEGIPALKTRSFMVTVEE